MSRGQTPRTPEFFPKMKDRAGRRRFRRERKRAVNELANQVATLPSTVNAIVEIAGKALVFLSDYVIATFSGFLKALGEHNARRQLTATPDQGGANADSDHPLRRDQRRHDTR